MAIDAGHWCWQRQRPDHHTGAIRAYMRDPDDDGYPRGPNSTPWLCKQCSHNSEYDSASPGSISWYLSSESESSPDDGYITNFCFAHPVNSRFNMDGMLYIIFTVSSVTIALCLKWSFNLCIHLRRSRDCPLTWSISMFLWFFISIPVNYYVLDVVTTFFWTNGKLRA